jgi:hypothetical protein
MRDQDLEQGQEAVDELEIKAQSFDDSVKREVDDKVAPPEMLPNIMSDQES